MSEAKFTPGPWRAWRNSSYWQIDAENFGQVGDACASSFLSGTNEFSNELAAAANAHVMAAAPDLYEALTKLLPLLEDDGDALSAIRADALSALCDQARAALAKASPPTEGGGK